MCESIIFCIIHCSVHEDINDNNDHESTSNFDDLDWRNETILLLVPVLSHGLVHTKLLDVSTEQQIIAEWSDSCNNKNKSMNMYFAKNVTKLSDVSTEPQCARWDNVVILVQHPFFN